MQIIMICGKARSGKDTLADFLIKDLKDKKPCKVQIGQYIKYYAMKYFGWDGEEETKPRDLLIHLGTDIIRNQIDPNFHINRLIEDLEVLSYFYDIFNASANMRYKKTSVCAYTQTLEIISKIKLEFLR